MPDENRIEPLTVANVETDKRVANVQVANPQRAGEPGQGGWTPTTVQILFATIGVAILGGLAPVLLTAIPGVAGVVTSVIVGGVATGLAGFFGIKSAGPRKLE